MLITLASTATWEEAEYVVRRARAPYPRKLDRRKRLVRGQTSVGRYLQVIYVVNPDDRLFVIHSRLLNEREKHLYRRSRR